MGVALNPQEYRELFLASLPPATDADTVMPDLRTLFTPAGHRSALEPDATIVRGARGVGKTVWFTALQNDLLRKVATEAYQLPRLEDVVPHSCFSSRLEPELFPGPATLDSLLGPEIEPIQIWRAVLSVALGVEGVRELSWPDRLGWVRANPESLENAIAAADRQAAAEGKTHLFLFDALEHLHVDRAKADRLVGGILRLALDLRTGTRRLRAKVFIRPDMLESGEIYFPDSSKLMANATELDWTETNLYGLLFQHLGNGPGETARRFRELTGYRWAESRAAGEDGDQVDQQGRARYVTPAEVSGDRTKQEPLFIGIAGPHMGSNHRKGKTYSWLPNHLMDGRSQVSPRSFLRALSTAAEVTRDNYASHEYALHYEGIRRGVQAASAIRVQEVAEDLPWVRTVVEILAGMQVPVELDAILARWSDRDLGVRLSHTMTGRNEEQVRTGPKDPHDYRGLVDELCVLGIMSRRADGRLDLPDVYRIAFDIGRRGGVPRIRPARQT